MNTGALYALGTETVIETEENNVRSFTVSITEYEGDEPGLTEIEAYSGAFDAGVSFVKLMNRDSDFVYDYYIDPSGTERFSLYAYGCSPALGGYEISCAGDDGCRAYIDGESIVVQCPVGKSCEVTVTDGVNSDTAVFRSSGSDELPYAMRADEYLLERRWKLKAQKAMFQNLINNFDQVAQNYCNIKLDEIRDKLAYLRWGIDSIRRMTVKPIPPSAVLRCRRRYLCISLSLCHSVCVLASWRFLYSGAPVTSRSILMPSGMAAGADGEP